VAVDIALRPGDKARLRIRHERRERLVLRAGEARFDAAKVVVGEGRAAALQMRPLRLDLVAKALRAALLHQDLDAGLVDVVAPPVAVVDTQDGFKVGEKMRPRQEFADHVANHRRPAESAADDHPKTGLARLVFLRVQPDVVHEGGRAIIGRAVHGDLELARQEAELGMESRPLPDELAPDKGVDDLVGRHTGEVIGGDVADAVARGLDRVHLHAGELAQDVGDPLQARPVELQVLPGGKMAVAAVVLASHRGELA
jgi:hypothetical protein